MKDRGFVLINALIIVAAMAAVAAALLMRAEQGRSRLMAGQDAAQLTLYLDAAETAAIAALARDRQNGTVDAADDGWARPIDNVPVDRGRITGQIRDMQGLFNVNWLVDPENTADRAAFVRLMARVSISANVAQGIISYVAPGGPLQKQPFARLTPPQRPTGGPVMTLDQLATVPGLSRDALVRLRRVATALPDSPPLNINTAPADVLASLLPGLSTAQIGQLTATRDTAPYTSVAEFTQQIELMTGIPLEDTVPQERLSVGSQWFLLEASATLDARTARRQAMLFRDALPKGVTTHWRVSVFP